jgi:Flp pilus assembly protein TadG
MKLSLLLDDTRGAALVEFAVALTVFVVITFGLIQVGLMMSAQAIMQKEVEMIARCANIAANNSTPQCNSASNITTFVATNYPGLRPVPTFTVTMNTTCGGNTGNLVSASYKFNILNLAFTKPSVTLTAEVCYPT